MQTHDRNIAVKTGLSLALSFLLVSCGGGGDGASGAATDAGTGAASASGPVGSGGTPVTTSSKSTSCSLISSAQAALDQLNQARAVGRNCGAVFYPAVAPVQWSDQLAAAAQAHSTDMATRDYVEHTNPDGIRPSQRMAQAGYVGSATAENIAAGQTSMDDVMKGWLSSEGHCKNIMSSRYKDYALACAKPESKTQYTYYWTQNFGSK